MSLLQGMEEKMRDLGMDRLELLKNYSELPESKKKLFDTLALRQRQVKALVLKLELVEREFWALTDLIDDDYINEGK